MENNFELTNEMMEKVNQFTRRGLSKDEIYAFPVLLCDNEVDRDNERFSIAALHKMAELFIGKTGIFDHNPKGENQTARIFDTEVKTYMDKVTSAGEPYTCLIGKAYMVKTNKSSDLIAEIDGGIKKEVSVSCSVSKNICSICGADMKKSPCTHIKGVKYGDKVCHVILDDPFDAYEWSFVAIPAQKNAGVTKRFGNVVNDNEVIKSLKCKMADLKRENSLAKDFLKREILRLSFLCSPVLTVKTVGILTESMGFEQLLELKNNLEQDYNSKTKKLTKKVESTGKQEKVNKNNNFKIN